MKRLFTLVFMLACSTAFAQWQGSSTVQYFTGGNVGIGVTGPTSKLVISDGSNAISVNPGTASGLGFNRNVSDGLIFNPSISAWQFSSRDDRFTLEGYNGPLHNLFTVLKNGNIGIGTVAPKGNLHIVAADESVSSAICIRQSNADVFGFDLGLDQNVNGNLFLYRVSSDNRQSVMEIDRQTGNIGLSHSPVSGYTLAIVGKALMEEVNVKAQANWPDYVFEKDYTLPSLNEVKSYIDENKHLPEVPSAKEVEKNGQNLGAMNMLLLKKVEELTLHAIQQQEQIDMLIRENEEFKSQTKINEELRSEIALINKKLNK
jgi:hypothetical protein